MSVSSTEHLDKLAFILYDRPSGRNIIGYAIEKIEQLREELSGATSNHDNASLEVERLRAENERLLATIAQIERMAAGAICSKEAIHSVALGALNAWSNPAMEVLIESDKVRREALEAKP